MNVNIIIFTISLLFLSCGPFWRSPEYYTQYDAFELKVPILTTEQYAERAATHSRPYIVSIDNKLILFGAEHTKDPANEQIDSIKAQWHRFKPTVALVEGRLGFLFRWTSDPIERFGESGFVYDLAKYHGVPAFTWEPRFEDEIAWALKKFPQKRVALFYILRPYFGQVKFQKPEDPNDFVTGTIGRRTKLKGLENSINNIAEIDSIWKADFFDKKDWRDTDDRYGWIGYLNDIAKESNAFRDEHLIQVIIHLVKNGERLFVVCGSSHAVKLENALISTLKQ